MRSPKLRSATYRQNTRCSTPADSMKMQGMAEPLGMPSKDGLMKTTRRKKNFKPPFFRTA